MGDEYHELKVIRLCANEPKSRRDLHVFLKGRGFVSMDDFYFIDRPDKPEPWQAISVISVHVFHQGTAVYETEKDIAESPGLWDELRVEYLLATLPRSFIETYAVECQALVAQFDLRMDLNGDPLEPDQLRPTLDKIADELTAQLDEPGSESLRILIELSHGR